MNLQTLLNQSDLDLTLPQIKAFLLGVIDGKKPLTSAKAVEELLLEVEEGKKELEAGILNLWEELQKNKVTELTNLFTVTSEFATFLETSKEQLDYFLTGLSLSGTSADYADKESLAEILEDLEDMVFELDDYLASDSVTDEESEELREELLEMWKEYLKISSKK